MTSPSPSTVLEVNVPYTLEVDITPSNATNQTGYWTVLYDSSEMTWTLNGNVLTITNAGTANNPWITLELAIPGGECDHNTHYFNISFHVHRPCIPVLRLDRHFPYEIWAGQTMPLTVIVNPSNATNQTVQWFVMSGVGWTSGSTYHAPTGMDDDVEKAEAIVQATILGGRCNADFVQHFSITVKNPHYCG